MSFDHPQSRRFGLALSVSLLLHGVAILILTRGGSHAPVSGTPPVASRHLVVQLKTTQPVLTRSASPLPALVDGPQAAIRTQPGRRAGIDRPPPHPAAGSITVGKSSPDRVAREFSVTSPAAPHDQNEAKHEPLDMDALQAQARALATENGSSSQGQRRGVPSSGPNAKKSEAILDRPVLPELARRVPVPSDSYTETTMTDGSRVIRFSGNRCMKIPRELPMGFKNDHGANIIVATNCSN